MLTQRRHSVLRLLLLLNQIYLYSTYPLQVALTYRVQFPATLQQPCHIHPRLGNQYLQSVCVQTTGRLKQMCSELSDYSPNENSQAPAIAKPPSISAFH